MRIDEAFLKQVLPTSTFVNIHSTYDVTFSCDSRTITKNDLFLPLKGEHADGHSYIMNALPKALGTFVSLSWFNEHGATMRAQYPHKLFIVVQDVQVAFFKLIEVYRAQFTFPIIGVTGSLGKTTTKYVAGQLLQAGGKNCFVAYGNQNTLLGIALNIARLTPEHDCAVFELGISKPGEMKELVALLQPTTAVITAIGHSHSAGLGSLKDIATEKKQIFSYFKHDSIGIINGDSPFLTTGSYHHPVIRFGKKMTNQIQARKIKTDDAGLSFTLKIYKDVYSISMHCLQEELVYPVLAAVTIAHYIGIDHAVIASHLQNLQFPQRRFEKRSLHGYKGYMIDDAYNASPESMKAALQALQKLKSKGRKIAILGDMKELGQSSQFWHRQVGRFLHKTPTIEKLILVGDQVQWIQETMPLSITTAQVPSWREAQELLQTMLQDDDVVLVKGSNSMKLSHLVESFTTQQDETQ